MLFDLKGKRRRTVQGVYLTLAVLMGAGLILFGVGSSVNGGLGSLFGSNGNGSNTGNSGLQKQINKLNRQVQANPHDLSALQQLVVDHYQLASTDANQTTGAFGSQGIAQLQLAGAAWQRYLAASRSPNAQLATYMVQAYGPNGLNQPKQAERAAEILAQAQPTTNAYINIVQFASLAKDTRTANLAAAKALQLASPSQRATVKLQISQAKAAGAASSSSSTTP